jgi:hypothetical protein
MLINHTTGEIAYHSIVLKEKGGIKFKQYPLKNKEGEVEFIPPSYWEEFKQRIKP